MSCVLRYQECHPEHGGPYCGGRGAKSSLCNHAAGGLLLWQVPESPAPVSGGCGHHPAKEHVCYAARHSAGSVPVCNTTIHYRMLLHFQFSAVLVLNKLTQLLHRLCKIYTLHEVQRTFLWLFPGWLCFHIKGTVLGLNPVKATRSDFKGWSFGIAFAP